MTPLRKRKLKTLAGLMKQQNRSSMPLTTHLLQLLDQVITPQETEFLLQMGTQPITYAQALQFCPTGVEKFDAFFDTLLRKGLVWPLEFRTESDRYELAPMLVGWFELQLCSGEETREKQEFARRLEHGFQSWKKNNVFPFRLLQNYYFLKTDAASQRIAAYRSPADSVKTRTIAVQRTLKPPDDSIYPAEDVCALIERHSGENDIALMHCFCRQWRKMVGDPCRFDYPPESCITIGPVTEYIVRYGFGRFVRKEEALAVIEQTRKAGAVHTVFYEKDDMQRPEIGICNCCPDCCGLLGSYNRSVFPLKFRSSFRSAVAAGDRCTGCGLCETVCPVQAIALTADGPIVDGDICLGCGQCDYQCPENVFRLERDERFVRLPLRKNSAARYGAASRQR
jgi:ferredoxin